MNITLTSSDISCGHCKATIEGDLREREGISNVLVTPEDKSIALTFDEGVISEDNIREIIEELGYDLS
ncbi:heavy-metal-associated domain-containing protein [Stomatohabitans albus]|uniref:heavy-metal-associated domain-containing protein n=1 Tax=Stomatohabitans albus TaxID=3110766 RepID=UPI00300C31DF